MCVCVCVCARLCVCVRVRLARVNLRNPTRKYIGFIQYIRQGGRDRSDHIRGRDDCGAEDKDMTAAGEDGCVPLPGRNTSNCTVLGESVCVCMWEFDHARGGRGGGGGAAGGSVFAFTWQEARLYF